MNQNFIKEIDKNLVKKLSLEYDYIIYNRSTQKLEVIETIEEGYKWKNNEILIYSTDEYKKRLKSSKIISETINEIPKMTYISKYIIEVFTKLNPLKEDKIIEEIFKVLNLYHFSSEFYEEFIKHFKYYRVNQKIALEEIARVLNHNIKKTEYGKYIPFISPIFDRKEYKYYELKANYGLDSYLKISPSIIYEILSSKNISIQKNSILEMDAKKRYGHIISRLKFPILYTREKKEKKIVTLEDVIKKNEKFVVINKKEIGNREEIEKIVNNSDINIF